MHNFWQFKKFNFKNFVFTKQKFKNWFIDFMLLLQQNIIKTWLNTILIAQLGILMMCQNLMNHKRSFAFLHLKLFKIWQ